MFLRWSSQPLPVFQSSTTSIEQPQSIVWVDCGPYSSAIRCIQRKTPAVVDGLQLTRLSIGRVCPSAPPSASPRSLAPTLDDQILPPSIPWQRPQPYD